jgi:hypothetical protein
MLGTWCRPGQSKDEVMIESALVAMRCLDMQRTQDLHFGVSSDSTTRPVVRLEVARCEKDHC